MAVTERTKRVERQAMLASHSAPARWRHSPWMVAGCVLAIYAVWIVAYLLGGHDIRDLAVIGTKQLQQSDASAVIHSATLHYTPRDPKGYDGQYAYFIALDPQNARFYTDFPAYRYTRILYPMLARALAFGQPALIPYTLLLVNWLAIGGGTLAVALWLRRKGYSPWLALIYAFAFGTLIGLQGDLTEPLAFALVACGVYAFDFGFAGNERRRIITAAGCFALAALTRETTAVFPVLYGMALLLGGAGGTARRGEWARWQAALRANWRRAAILLGVALAPLALYKLALYAWLGSAGVPQQVRFEAIPFAGLFAYWPWNGLRIVEIDVVVLPALICLGMGLWALRRGVCEVALGVLVANILLFVLLLPASSYVDAFASARIGLGVVLGAIYCLPLFDRLTQRRLWLVAASGFWLLFVPLQALGSIVSR